MKDLKETFLGESQSNSEETEKDLPENCLNCETKLYGIFCSKCGQAADVKPYTLKLLGKDLFDFIKRFDKEFRNTFTALLMRPAEFCEEYLAGKRKPYQEPVKYFFITFFIQVVIFGAVRFFATTPEIDEAASIDTKTQMFYLAATFIFAFSYTVAFRKTGRNLAENTVCLIFLIAETQLFTIFIQLVFLPLATFWSHAQTYNSILDVSLSFGYLIFFSRYFYKESWAKVVVKNILIMLATMTIIAFCLAIWSILTNKFGLPNP